MEYLLSGGIVSFIFGLLLLAAPGLLGALGSVSNSVIIAVDGWLTRSKVLAGLVLLVVGAWLLSVAVQYPVWYIHAAWMVAIAFGLLLLFFPGWLSWLSKASNAVLFSTDDLVSGARKTFGAILMIISFYIFYVTLLAR